MEEPVTSRKTTVFPNPFTDRIQLSTTMANSHYVLYGSGGKMIWQGQHIEAMDWGWLPAGNYLLGIAGENILETLNLIKK